MSFDTYREFEASLLAARERRKKPNVNKTVLKKFILSTEAHNRNQEEQEMWMRHFASKKENGESSSPRECRKRKKSSKKKKSKKKCDGAKSSSDDSLVGPDVASFIDSKKPKWGHDGFHELYGDEDDLSSSNEKRKRDWRKKIDQSIETDPGRDLGRNERMKKKPRKNPIPKSESTSHPISSENSSTDDDYKIVKKSRKRKKKKRKKQKLEWVEK